MFDNTIFLFILAIIILTIIVSITTAIIEQKKLTIKIKQLWTNKERLEEFIRPNARYDYQYQSYRSNYAHDNLVDDKTWSDLSMDSLFQTMNYNFTAIGEMKLYATLRGMFKANNKTLIHKIKTSESFRNYLSLKLSKVGKKYYPFFPDQLTAIKRNNLLMLTPFLPILSILIIVFNKNLGILLTLLVCSINILLSVFLKRTYEKDLKSIFYTSNVLTQSKKLNELDGTPELNINFNHFKSSRYLSGILVKLDANDIGSSIILLFKIIFMLDYVIFHIIQRSFFKYIDEVLESYDYIAMLDNHYSVALYQTTLNIQCQPEILDNHVKDESLCTFTELVHPLIDGAVPNNLCLKNNILLTGSNASGKSTFMKAIAINLILAQTIETAVAAEFKYVPGHVYCSMANADDVLSGDSYFMAELKSIRRLFNISSKRQIYCFIDEIFKGTNTTERIAASQSVLSFLSNMNNYFILAATHDIELSSLLDYSNYHFNEIIEKQSIAFDYKVKPGKANTRNAIELLRISNFPLDIYHHAKEIVEDI
ncbi:MutS-related protein [Staphylococcus lugdunensis]|uniref:MutS-related protein n=1 Tax=Staphylococcus lugdunensis TaxID=28035 RepID=UPI0012488370|nr:MutS family DNA mismatch repair protein [Staphylococcus lugdunensis]QEX25508.1 MutS family DNA mismatch repair protein [Staphylococcus lugdunensis]QEX35082.1 MutS family DNA mismatch repair protein [Staphylococcus lugdunensis]